MSASTGATASPLTPTAGCTAACTPAAKRSAKARPQTGACQSPASAAQEAQLLSDAAARSRYVDYCMRLVDMLRRHGVLPVVVFDGGRLPMKGEEEVSRGRCAPNPGHCHQPAVQPVLGARRWLLDCRASEGLRLRLAGCARSSLPRRKRTQPQATALLPSNATSAPWTSAPMLRCASSRHVEACIMP